MTKTACKILGIVLLLVGLVGFLKHDLLGLHLTTVHNIAHLVTGAIALYFGFIGSAGAAHIFCLVFGVIYLLLGAIGFIAPQVVTAIIQVHGEGISLTPDNIVHLLLGAVFLIVGLLREPQAVQQQMSGQ
jgi:hypothetical protein